MPFGLDAVFAAIRQGTHDAIPDEPIDCYWMKDQHAAGKITDDIERGIQSAAFCIADLSTASANVMWETGYAMASGKPTILIGQSIESVPVDLKIYRVIPYSLDDLDSLAKRLTEAVRQTLSRYEIRGAAPARVHRASHARSIVVTGTDKASPLKTTRRVEMILSPYLGRGIDWYCGSFGFVDEAAAKYLVEAKERVFVVGFHRYDVTPVIRSYIANGAAAFIDASTENVPKTMDGSSSRNKYFAIKDLVILFWDSESSGTARMIEYFRDNHTNMLTAFV